MRTASFWVVVAFLGIAAFFLLTEHRAHAWGALPYLLLLACPLLHFLMHGGHGHGGHGQSKAGGRRESAHRAEPSEPAAAPRGDQR